MLWAIAGAAALGIELFTLDLTFALIALGAFAGAGAAALGAPLWGQMVVAGVVALAGLLFLRPIARRHLRRVPRELRTGVDALPGATAIALTSVTTEGGRIRLRNEEWSARLDTDVTDIQVDVGTRVYVTRIDGATAVVFPIGE
ncbi:MAG: NfeD family protein [Actinobacteria bacterium]|nr:NfeD family protein [Actinomycetota bacterium]